MRLTIQSDVAAQKWKKNWDGSAERWSNALTATMNIIASMVEQEARADIKSAGRFGDDWTSALNVTVEGGAIGNMRLSLELDHPGAEIFQDGGTIDGNPLLWLPISGTDAEDVRASDYPGELFSVNSPKSSHPLLFAVSDKLPKYFGIEAVTIPKKFHLEEVATSVMANFRQIFDDQLKS